MKNVLILDDNPFVCEAIQKQVLALGVSQALIAHSAREALSLLTNDKVGVDLVICDLRLPETDGIEFLRELHKINKEVAVAILSGQDESVLLAAAQVAERYGFNVVGYVAKPASPEDLRGLLRRLEFNSDRALAFSAIEVSDDQIRQGIAQREFTCSYQPLVEIVSGIPVGVEALARRR